MDKPIDGEETIVLSEREYVYFGMCPDAVRFLRDANMFGKPNGEVKRFIAAKGKSEWLKDWEETHLSPHVLDRIKKRLHPEYYTSTYMVTDNFTKSQQEFATLDEAKAQDTQNKIEFLNKIGDPYDPSVDVNDQIGYHYKLFIIEEKMTTFTGHVVHKPLNA